MAFAWRSVQPRPSVEVEVCRTEHSDWKIFAPFHYMSADLLKAARCWVLKVGGEKVAFVGESRFPHPKVKNIRRINRAVCLPDWQGLGLVFALMDTVGKVYWSQKERVRAYPAHPSFIRSFQRHERWKRCQKLGQPTSVNMKGARKRNCAIGGRAMSSFEWVGGDGGIDSTTARQLLAG